MYKGLNESQQKEISDYCNRALTHLYLPKENYNYKLNNHEDVEFRKNFDKQRPTPYGGSNPGYYAYYDECKAILIDADDYLINIDNDSVWKIKVLHEVRHAYQYKQIELLENNKTCDEQKEVILSWKKDFEFKKINGANMFNVTELDANKYSSLNWDKF